MHFGHHFKREVSPFDFMAYKVQPSIPMGSQVEMSNKVTIQVPAESARQPLRHRRKHCAGSRQWVSMLPRKPGAAA